MQPKCSTLEKMVVGGTNTPEEINELLKRGCDRADQYRALEAAIENGRLEAFRTIATEVNKFGITGREQASLMQAAKRVQLSEKIRQYFCMFVGKALKIRWGDRYVITETTAL